MEPLQKLARQGIFMSNDFLKATLNKGSLFIKGTVLQQLAKRMSAEDAKFLTIQWKSHFSSESPAAALPSTVTTATTAATATTTPPLPSPPFAADTEPSPASHPEPVIPLSEAALTPTIREVIKEVVMKNEEHPVFGRLVANVGYKKVYLSSVENLINMSIWNKQRILRGNRAKEIAANKLSTNKDPCFPGVIALFQDEESGECGIIDGQHRVAALLLMATNGKWSKTDRNVIIEVFQTRGESEIVSLFRGTYMLYAICYVMLYAICYMLYGMLCYMLCL